MVEGDMRQSLCEGVTLNGWFEMRELALSVW